MIQIPVDSLPVPGSLPSVVPDVPAHLQAWSSPSFTPGRKDFPALVAVYLSVRDDSPQTRRLQATCQKALLRAGQLAAVYVLSVFPTVTPIDRPRVVTLFGSLIDPQAPGAERVVASLLALATLDDLRVLRQVLIALGRLLPAHAALIEPVLLRVAPALVVPPDVRALAETLGKLGTPAALAVLQELSARGPWPPVVAQVIERALVRSQRDHLRAALPVEGHVLRGEVSLPQTTQVVLRCRAGLGELLRRELIDRGLVSGGVLRLLDPIVTGLSPQHSAQPGALQPGPVPAAEVRFPWSGPLAHLFSARLFSELALEVPLVAAGRSAAGPDARVIETLCQPTTQALLSALLPGPLRYRLHFLDGQHHRNRVFQLAQAIAQRAPALVNDPIDAPWQIELSDDDRATMLALVPRKLVDARFDYRLDAVPAASHPPLSAALARLLNAPTQAVVWDPFVGSGTEIIEVARLSGCQHLYGSDTDERALALARQNLRAAKLSSVKLTHGDALRLAPPSVTHIITNPPMGRRTRPGPLGELLASFLQHAAQLLPARGRLVWISPQPRLTAGIGQQAGLTLLQTLPVDLRGFWGHIEVWQQN